MFEPGMSAYDKVNTQSIRLIPKINECQSLSYALYPATRQYVMVNNVTRNIVAKK